MMDRLMIISDMEVNMGDETVLEIGDDLKQDDNFQGSRLPELIGWLVGWLIDWLAG